MPDDEVRIPQAVPPLQQRVTFRIARVHARMNAQATRLLKTHADLSLSQWRVLVMIDGGDGTTAAEIVRRTQMDKGLISRTIKGMTDEGLIVQEVSKRDQRSHVLHLTPAGQRRFDLARPHMLSRQMRLMHSLSEKDRAAFYAVLENLEDTLDDMDAED